MRKPIPRYCLLFGITLLAITNFGQESFDPFCIDKTSSKHFPGLRSYPDEFPSSWDLFYPAWEEPSQGSPSDTDLSKIIHEPVDGMGDELTIPDSLKDRVLFWTRIYTEYSDTMRVIHDRNNPAIIYGHIDFLPLMEQAGSHGISEKRLNQIERYILQELTRRVKAAYGFEVHSIRPRAEKVAIQNFFMGHGIVEPGEVLGHLEYLRTQRGQSNHFQKALARSENLLPQIEELFREHRLPQGLTRIPFVESSFNDRARSKCGAFGIWQFMPRTAKQYIPGRNMVKWRQALPQSVGALRLLQHYHRILKDWGLVIIAYNSGVGRIQKIKEKYEVDNAPSLLAHPGTRKVLGFAGMNFLAEVLAANLLTNNKGVLFPVWDTQKGSQTAKAEFCTAGLGDVKRDLAVE